MSRVSDLPQAVQKTSGSTLFDNYSFRSRNIPGKTNFINIPCVENDMLFLLCLGLDRE